MMYLQCLPRKPVRAKGLRDLWKGGWIAQSRLHTIDEIGRKTTALIDTSEVANLCCVKTKRATITTMRSTDAPRTKTLLQ